MFVDIPVDVSWSVDRSQCMANYTRSLKWIFDFYAVNLVGFES